MDSTPIGTNRTNEKTSHLESTPVDRKTTDPKTLTRSMELSKRNGKEHVTDDPESDPSSSDSSLRKYDSSNDRKYSKSKIKRLDRKKKRRKHTRQESSESSLSESNSFDRIDYESNKCNKNKRYIQNDPIKLCVKLTAKFPTTVYKSKIIKLKFDEDLLQRRIYFLTVT